MRRAMITTMAVAALVAGGLAAPAGAQEDPGTIVDIAAGSPDLSTLVTAVTEAGLVETLSGDEDNVVVRAAPV